MSKATTRSAPKAAPKPPSISKHFNLKSSAPSQLSSTPTNKTARPIKGSSGQK